MGWMLAGLLAWTTGLVLAHAILCAILWPITVSVFWQHLSVELLVAAPGVFIFYFISGFAWRNFVFAAICTCSICFTRHRWPIYVLYPPSSLAAFLWMLETPPDRWVAEILAIHQSYIGVLIAAALASAWVMLRMAAPHEIISRTNSRVRSH